MEKTLKIIFVLFTIYNVISCNNTKNDNKNKESVNIDKMAMTNINIENLFDHISFLSIDNNNTLLPGAAKIIYKNSEIYISDGFILYIYDTNGKIIGLIDKKGKAKGEYLEITDFDVSNNKIILLDRNKKNVLIYDKQGLFKFDVKLNVYASTLAIKDDSLLILNNDYSTHENSQNGKITLININSRETSYFGTYNVNKTSYMHMIGGFNFYKNGKDLFFYESFNPRVYKIEDQDIVETIYIKMPNMPQDDYYNTNFRDVADFITNFTQKNYASGIRNFYCSDQKIIVKFFYNQNEYYCLYNKNTKQVDLMGQIFLYDEIKINNIFFNEGQAVASISAYRLIDAISKNKRIADLVQKYNITENSSPLLLIINNIN